MIGPLQEALDAGQPVDWDHSINRGLSRWYLLAPDGHASFRGGSRLLDLCRRGHGTLTSTSLPSIPTWSARSRIGGWGSIATNGTTSYVDCGTIPGLDGSTRASYAAWIYRTSGTTAGLGATAGSTGAGFLFSFICFTDNVIYVSAGGPSGTGYGFRSIGSGWTRVLVTFEGSGAGNSDRLKLYLNGLAQSLSFSGTIPTALGAVSPWTIGRDASNRYAAGNYDDVRIYAGRTLTPADAWLDYELSRGRWQWGLNRVRRFLVSSPSSGASEGAAGLTIGAFVLSGSGATSTAGSLAETINPFPLAGSAATAASGALADSLGEFTISGAGATGTSAVLVVAAGDFTLAGSAGAVAASTLAALLGDFALDGSGAAATASAMATPLGEFALLGSGVTATSATLAAAVPAFTLAGVGSSDLGGDSGGVLEGGLIGPFALDGAGGVATSSALATTLPAFALAAAAGSGCSGALSVGPGSFLLAASASTANYGSLAAAMGSFSLSAAAASAGDAAGSLSIPLGSFTLLGIVVVGAGPVEARGLVAALQGRIAAVLGPELPGGIFFGPPDEEADESPPYATWILIGERPIHDTGGMSAKEAAFRMKLVGPDEEELRRIHEEVWEENFHPRMEPLAIANRSFRGLYDGPAHIDVGVMMSPLGYNFVCRWWDFSVYTTLRRVTT